MIEFFEKIKKKINNKFISTKILVIDNSHLHVGHKSFDPKKFHLKIIIHSKELNKMGKIEAHKEIYNILKDEMHDKIHALEIQIN